MKGWRAPTGDAFARDLGLRWDGPDVVRLEIRPELVNGVGLLLGPVVFSLADYCMTTAMWARTSEDERIATLNVALSFVDSATQGEVVCRATVDRRSRRVGAVRCELRHAVDERLLATALGTFAISPRPSA